MRALAADTLRALQQPLDFMKGQAVVDEDGVIHSVAEDFAWTAGARAQRRHGCQRTQRTK